MSNVLITGAAGFIGSNISDALLFAGHRVCAIDNLATGNKANLPIGKHPNLKFIEGTIADEDLINETFDSFKPDVVVHCAASYKNPQDYIEDVLTNVLGGVHIVQACKDFKVKRLIYFQTSLCYGLNPKQVPVPLTEPLNPHGSSYSLSKYLSEMYMELSGIDYVSFRLEHIMGERNVGGPIPVFWKRLTKGEKCFITDTKRSFVYIADLLSVVLQAITGVGRRGAYNIGSGVEYTIKEIYDSVSKALGKTGPFELVGKVANDAHTIVLDTSKTRKDFNWTPTVPFEDGVKKTVDYYNKHGLGDTFTHLDLSKFDVKK